MKPKLSICIPTYNRSGCLKECLDSIMISISGYENQIEIVISDNASTDNTADIVRSFQIKYPWIRYHRNDENIGGDPNIYLVATMASGKHIWVFGDDDKMEKEAVATVIKQINAGYNLIICNYSMWAKDFTYIKKKNGLQLNYDEVFDSPNKLLKRIGYHVGYISSIIIKKDVFFKIPKSEYLHYMDFSLPQIYAVYSGIIGHCNAIYISSTMVCHRSDNHGQIDWCKIYLIGIPMIFEGLSNKGYLRSAIRSAKCNVLRNILIPSIIEYKLNNRQLPNNMRSVMLQHYKKNWLYWLIALPALLMPGFMLRLTKKVKVITLRWMKESETRRDRGNA